MAGSVKPGGNYEGDTKGFGELLDVWSSHCMQIDDPIFQDDWNALQLSTHAGHQQATEVLMKRGANVNTQMKGHVVPNISPLHLAVKSSSIEVVMTLLSNEAVDVNCQDQWGFSPLHFAAFTGNKPIVSALLSHGASTNIKSVSGTSPTDIAKELNFVDVLTLLMSKTKIDEDPNTPKFRAWLNHLGGGEFIQKFFDSGYDLAFVAKSGLDDRDLDCVGIPMSKLGLRKKLLSLHDLDRFYVPGEEEEEEDGDDEDEGEEEDDEGEEEDEGDEEDDD